MDVAALVLSIVAIVVSIGAVVYTRMAGLAQRELTRIEGERRAEELRQRGEADLSVTTERVDKNVRLVVTKRGLATARELTVETAGADPDGKPAPTMNTAFPSSLEPDSRASTSLSTTFGTAILVAVTVGWRDDHGRHSKVVELGLY